MLMSKVPPENVNLRASMIMISYPSTLNPVANIKDITEALSKGFRQYPILNKAG